MSQIKRFEDLIAWQKARDLARAICQISRQGAFAASILVFLLALLLPSFALSPQSSSLGPDLLPGQTATLLPDGRWLLVGGEGADGTPLSAASIWDPRIPHAAIDIANLNRARSYHSATVLPDGIVLILGGIGADGQVLSSPELFHVETQSFTLLIPQSSSLSPELTARARHTATLLTDGHVLIAGGISADGEIHSDAELWNPSSNSAIRIPQSTARQDHTATLLPDGGVLLSGGTDKDGNKLDTAELFDPGTQSFTPSTILDPLSSILNPELAGSLPADGSIDVPTDSLISLRFTKPVRVETVNAETVTLSGPQGIEGIKVVPAEGGRLAFITPDFPLLPGATYTLSLNGAVDRDGFLLPVSGFSFTTQPSAVSTPPSAISNQPSGGITTSSSFPSESEIQNPKSKIGGVDWKDQFAWKGERKDGKPHSPWQDLPPLQAEEGVTALAGQALQLTGDPLPDITIHVEGKKARTDKTGRFLLPRLTPGHHKMIIDGRSANTKDKAYGIFVSSVNLLEGITSVLPFTIWMTELDMENAVAISSPTTSEVVVTTPKIPGLEVRIPPGTVIRDIDGKVVKEVSLTPIPLDRGPMLGPRGVNLPFLFTTQPGGSVVEGIKGSLSPGIRIIFPNSSALPPGARANFWKPDPHVGWFVYGQGRVSADGSQVVPDPGVGIHMLSCVSLEHEDNAPQLDASVGGVAKSGDPVDLGTGLFVLEKTDFFLPDIIPIKLTRTYRQNDTLSRPFGVGATHPYEIFLVGDTTAYSYAELILPDGGRIRYNRISAGTGFTDAVMEHTATPTAFYKSVLSWRQPRGWDIKLKDGTVYHIDVEFIGDTVGLTGLGAIRDRSGNQLTVTRDSSNKVTRITSPNGRWVEFTYDASDRITQAKDNLERTVTYAYDANGRLSTVTDPNGGVTTYTYDDTDPTDLNRKTRMLTIRDARAIVFLTNEYDVTGKVIKQTQADTSTYLFNYTVDINVRVIQTDVTDPRGNIRRANFNADKQIVADKRALGRPEEQTTTYEVQAGTNLVLSVTDPLSRNTASTYDSFGNVTSITRLSGTPDAVTTTFTYEPVFNQVATTTDPLGRTTTFSYDALGNLSSVTNPLNQATTFTYNAAGQPLSTTNPLGNTTQFTYDFGDLVATTDPLGNTTTRFTDAAGRLLSLSNPLGHLTRSDYDVLNRLLKVTDPLGGLTNFGYDPNGNLLSVTDVRNSVTAYTYNSMDRLATRTDPLLKVEGYQYDLAGNLTQFTDRKAQVTGTTYDALNRRTLVTYADLSTTAYTYDAGNRLTQIADSVSGTISRTYDNLNRLTSESTPQGSMSYTYDSAGRRTSMTVFGQPTVNYAYDNANRLIQITQGTSVVTMGYDAAGRRTSLTLPNGVLVEYIFDAASRVSSITYKKGLTVLGNLTYDYDKAGNRTRLSGSFARSGIPQPITSASYNGANQQLALGNKTMTFDNNGNLTSIIDASGTTLYTWNARNQLTGISGPGVNAGLVYDGLGRREKKTVNSNLTEFLYDGVNPVQETSGATVLANILTGLGIDEYLTRTDVLAGMTSHFLPDALGSALALADSTGTIQTQYTYEPFGKTTASGPANTNPFQFTGRENDGTGLFYYRARYYHPQLQRFISEDPIEFFGGDVNLYGYIANNPLRYVDPFGLSRKDPDFSSGGNLSSGFSNPSAGLQFAAADTGGQVMSDAVRNPSAPETKLFQPPPPDCLRFGPQCNPPPRPPECDRNCPVVIPPSGCSAGRVTCYPGGWWRPNINPRFTPIFP